MRVAIGFLLAGLAVLATAHCSSEDDDGIGANGTGASAASGGSGGTAGSGGLPFGGNTSTAGNTGTAGSGATNTGGWNQGGFAEVACDGQVWECGDTIDNDGDGLIDWADPDCLGVCDNNEAGFVTNIPGGSSTNKCKRDCYFDDDSGTGNDDCFWDLWCDPAEPQLIYCEYSDPPPAQADCPDNQSQTCLDVCLPLVPNGCDCFGCCELPAESGHFVYIGSEDDDGPTCELGEEMDPSQCHECNPVADCYDECGHCELCVGKTTLPPDCFDSDGGVEDQCPPELQPCGLPGQDPCPSSHYCVTGCCRPVPT